MPFKFKILPCLLTVLLIFGCDHFKGLSNRSKLLLKKDDKLFRGLHFDMNIDQVKQFETAPLAEEIKDYLRYKIDADSIQAKEYVELEYFFNSSGKMDWLIGFYSLRNREDIAPIIEELKVFYERKYGPASQDEFGWYHWEFQDKKGEPGRIEINLVGETEEEYLGVEVEMMKFYENQTSK